MVNATDWDRRKRPPIVRFFEKVEIRDDQLGCWEWVGHIDAHGYGVFVLNKSDGDNVTVRPHRWFYEHAYGEVDRELVMDHLCRVRHCVNPEHLEPVSIRENVLRGETQPARNLAKNECVSGHPLGGDNLRLLPNGHRICVTCARRRTRESSGYNRDEQLERVREWRRTLVDFEDVRLSRSQVGIIGELGDHYIVEPRGHKLRSLNALDKRGIAECYSGKWMLTHKGCRAYAHLFADDLPDMGVALGEMVRRERPDNVTDLRKAE